jgi:hypothetical protein
VEMMDDDASGRMATRFPLDNMTMLQNYFLLNVTKFNMAKCNLFWEILILFTSFKTVLYLSTGFILDQMWRIREILVRIRIRGSIPPTNGSGSCYFRQWPSRHQQKKKISSFFAYYFMKVHSHHFSKIKSHKEVTSCFIQTLHNYAYSLNKIFFKTSKYLLNPGFPLIVGLNFAFSVKFVAF